MWFNLILALATVLFSAVREDSMKRAMDSTLLVLGDNGNQGTAFFVNENGDALTCWHVVAGSSNVAVVDMYGNFYKANVSTSSATGDMAVLHMKVKHGSDRFLIFAESKNVVVGEDVFSFGNPSVHLFTASQGIVSAKREGLPNGDYSQPVLQTTVPIQRGSSGSAIMDSNAEVVGMAFVIYSQNKQGIIVNEGMNYGVASDVLTRFLKRNKIRYYIRRDSVRREG